MPTAPSTCTRPTPKASGPARLSPDGITFDQGHAKGDAALRGKAADLLLWSWNRVPVDARFEVFGDAAVLEVWRTVVSF